MNWKQLWKKYHNTNIQWHKNDDHPSCEGVDTIRFYLSHLELDLVTQDETVDWFRREAKRSYIRTIDMDTLYSTFADELEQTNLLEPSERLIDDDPYAPIKREMLRRCNEHTGKANRGLIVDLQFLRGVYTTSHLRPTRFVFAFYSAGTWIGQRDDQDTDSMAYSKGFRSWMQATSGSERHYFIVDIPQSGYVLNEVEAWKAYRFLICDPHMSKDEAERALHR
jgi:hypothetical protein